MTDKPVISLPSGVVWNGTNAELVDLMAAVFKSCKDPSSHPENSTLDGTMCGRATGVCEMCKSLNDQKVLDELLWARRTAHLAREWHEVGHPNGFIPRDAE